MKTSVTHFKKVLALFFLAFCFGASPCFAQSYLPVAVASDGTSGLGVLPCGGSAQPACANGVASGTTACGLVGQIPCSSPDLTAAEVMASLDSASVASAFSIPFIFLMSLYLLSHGVGLILKMLRDA